MPNTLRSAPLRSALPGSGAARTAALRSARLLAFGAPAALLAGAYIAQYGFGLYPCEMCWWQRYAHFAALAFAVVAFALPRHRAPIVFAALAILASGLIGGYHAGVEYQWWQGLTACTASPMAAGGNPLDAIMGGPMIRCDVAQWTLAGISLAGFNFVLSVLAALGLFALLRRRRA